MWKDLLRTVLIGFMGLILCSGEGMADTVNSYRKDTDDPDLVTVVGRQGKVVAVSPTVVTLERSNQTLDFPVNEIESICFDDEPVTLPTIRLAVQTGDFLHASEALSQIDTSGIANPLVLQDIEYFKAYIAAQEVLTPGVSKENIRDGVRLMANFLKNHPESWRMLKATEIVGDLAVASGALEQAVRFYEPLVTAPWTDYQMRGQIAIANIDLAAGRIDQAKTGFEAVINNPETTPVAKRQKIVARMGAARCLAQQKNLDQAIVAMEEVVKLTNPEDTPLCAAACNLLGDFFLEDGKKNEALLAYLRVDLLYSNVRLEHIKALQHLAQLWHERGKIDRESEVRQKLNDRYGIALDIVLDEE